MTNVEAHWEHFNHEADIGVRGFDSSKAGAFEQAALAMIAVITDPDSVSGEIFTEISCQAPDDELLLVDWLNALGYEIATHKVLFSSFKVAIQNSHLVATLLGEKMNIEKHHPAVEVKGATYTELRVHQQDDGSWIAQCVVDV